MRAFLLASQATAAGVRRRLGAILHFAILFVDSSLTRSIYTSENKASVYSNSGFHLVDASSRRHAWTGAVSYKARSHAGLHVLAFFFFPRKSVMAAGASWRGGCRHSWRVLQARGRLWHSPFSFPFFSLSPKFITS